MSENISENTNDVVPLCLIILYVYKYTVNKTIKNALALDKR